MIRAEPHELAALLDSDPEARSRFDRLTLRQRRCYLDWICEERHSTARLSRASLVLRAIAA